MKWKRITSISLLFITICAAAGPRPSEPTLYAFRLQPGEDSLHGAAGNDLMIGGLGADKVDVRDGEFDFIIDGPGDELEVVPKLDVVP